jgi:ERCC4-type nuclease
MDIRLLRSMRDGKVWHNPGDVLEADEETAKYLIAKKAAVPLEAEEEVPDDTDEGLTTEEVNEIRESLNEIDGVNDVIADELIRAGYTSIKAVAEAEEKDLIAIRGIGKSTASKIQESAEELTEE